MNEHNGRIPLAIPCKPWFQDHRFGGRAVLPAVETMLLLAARVAEIHPEVDIRVMANGRFAKFLEIPPGAATLAAFVSCEKESDGRVRGKLLSRIQGRVMSRIQEHGEICFSPADPAVDPVADFVGDPPAGPLTEIGVEELYRELVPFGPRYRTLRKTLFLSDCEAWGSLEAPRLPIDPIQQIIGSPFPLDGALHAACVLGRQAVDFVPFPVGFSRRVISRPTQPGCRYRTKVIQRSRTGEELVFDLAIFDDAGRIFETVSGVRMRDVRGTSKK